MLAIPHHIRYTAESRFDAGGLKLAVAVADTGLSTQFFSGQLERPRRTALMLRGLMSIVQSRFHIPAAMLARILAAADPVVTASSDRLRFEGFSGCCGVYVRVDLLPNAVRDAKFGRGTTNVDFNAPMLAALAKVRETDKVSLNVDAGAVELKTESGAVVEKKVDLPVRWLRGFLRCRGYRDGQGENQGDRSEHGEKLPAGPFVRDVRIAGRCKPLSGS